MKISKSQRGYIISFIILIIILNFIISEDNVENINYNSNLSDFENLSYNSSKFLSDPYKNINWSHWDHMPLTYRIDESCSLRQSNLTRFAFYKVQDETYGIVNFREVNDTSDISIYCKISEGYKDGEKPIADAYPQIDKGIINNGIINIYGQGQVCLTGYPTLEVHEILHLFDIGHNPNTKSIMFPYAAESSQDCKITKIDKEYVSCLQYVYSNALFNGSCNFPNYIHEIDKYSCKDGWFEVEGTNYCCPEQGMIIDEEGYCSY